MPIAQNLMMKKVRNIWFQMSRSSRHVQVSVSKILAETPAPGTDCTTRLCVKFRSEKMCVTLKQDCVMGPLSHYTNLA